MSFSKNGVKINSTWYTRNRTAGAVFRFFEVVLSVFFVITLASTIIFPQQAHGALGVSKYLSYQGRLTDSNGNPLGGTGTNYCFSFSVFDASSGGNKLWPSGATTTTILNVANGVFNTSVGDISSFDFSSNDTTYLNVDVAAQSGGTCTGVSWEGLLPRQKLDAVAYARVAAEVWGDRLRTDVTNGRVQIGFGTGGGSPIFFRPDVKNTGDTLGGACPSGAVAGSIWYNSSNTRALMCNSAGNIVAIDNTNEITNLNITGNTAGTPAAISTGAVSFAGGNNITLSQSGNAITASAPNLIYALGVSNTGNTAGNTGTRNNATFVFAGSNNITVSQSTGAASVHTIWVSGAAAGGAGTNTFGMSNLGNTAGTSGTINGSAMQMIFAGGANITLSQSINGSSATISIVGEAGGGGGAPNLSLWQHPRGVLLGGVGNITNVTALSNRPFFVPVAFDGNITLKSLALQLSRAATGSNLFTVQYGLYTYVNSTQISLRGSCQETFSNTATASVSGIRALWLTCLGTHTNASTVSPGNYVLGFYFSAGATASMNYSLRGQSTANAWVLGQVYPGANVASTATSQGYIPMFGRYSTTHAAPIAGSYAQSQILGMNSGASLQIDPALSIRNF